VIIAFLKYPQVYQQKDDDQDKKDGKEDEFVAHVVTEWKAKLNEFALTKPPNPLKGAFYVFLCFLQVI